MKWAPSLSVQVQVQVPVQVPVRLGRVYVNCDRRCRELATTTE